MRELTVTNVDHAVQLLPYLSRIDGSPNFWIRNIFKNSASGLLSVA